MKDFAKNLRIAMNEADMNQLELARKSGCSKAAVSQYLAGKNVPGPEKKRALAAALGVEEEYFDRKQEAARPPVVTRIGTKTAAQCLGKGEQFVREGLKRGILPFGNAVPGSGKQWNYYINPAKFREYVGEEQFNAFFGVKA